MVCKHIHVQNLFKNIVKLYQIDCNELCACAHNPVINKQIQSDSSFADEQSKCLDINLQDKRECLFFY